MMANNDDGTEFWLGIDLGTTSVKLVLLDKCGNVEISESRQTLADVSSDAGECGYEQDPSKIMATAEDLIHKVVASCKGNIKGVGITGQMHGVMLWKPEKHSAKLDSAGTENTPHHSNLYTWQDQRCTPEFLASLPVQSDSQQTLSTGYGCATLFWLAHYRSTLIKDQGFTACGTIMDYLVSKLCSLEHPITSDQLAASFGFYNKDSVAWESMLQTGNFPHHLLPQIIPAGKVAGHTFGHANLPQGIPVFVALGDVQCTMFAVLSSPQDAAVNISTSIQLGFAVSKEKRENVVKKSPCCISFFPYFDGQELALFAGLNGGNIFQCFAESMAQWVCDLGLASNIDPSDLLLKLQQLSENTTAGDSSASGTANSLPTVNPVFFGERHNVNMKASFSNLDYANLQNVGLLFRALSEGLVNHLASMVSLQYLTEQGITTLRVSGSVPTSNRIVMRRLKDLYSGNTGTFNNFEVSEMGVTDKRIGQDVEDRTVLKKTLEILIDTQGLEAVSSAIGAAKVALLQKANR
ncbi:sedoheptulokinase-like [Plakobranchus ocellatus]|uniref:Sedoheptulokinase-like n=1 Tax=Plakobranchus ocellatus TaxID=259542 RepID=A0AAV4C041_9GAST|nr:sedoheptulokinase-like [Plakobranchus ocellatus]